MDSAKKRPGSSVNSAGTPLAQYSPSFPGGLGVMKRTILAATIVAVTACGGGDATLSPVGPSRTSSSAGASISGTVSGTGVTATRTLDGGAFSMLASSSVTGSIAGTNIPTTTDGPGQFTPNNRPAGNADAKFTPPRARGTDTPSGIRPADEVQ